MSVSIVLTGIMMLIIRVCGRQVFHPLVYVFEQAVFPIIDKDARCDVHSGNQNETLTKFAFLEELLNFISDANIFSAFLRFKPEIFGMRTETFRCFQYPISKCMKDVPTYMTTDRGYVDSHKFTGCSGPDKEFYFSQWQLLHGMTRSI